MTEQPEQILEPGPAPAAGETAIPVPPEDADPQEVAEEAAAAEPGNNYAPGFIPDNQPDWLVTFLRKLEQAIFG